MSSEASGETPATTTPVTSSSSQEHEPTSSLPSLHLLCQDLAHIIQDTKQHPSIQEQINAINAAVQTRILRLEELGSIINTAKAGREEARTDVIPELLRQTREMEDVYRKIDRIQVLLNHMDTALNAVGDRAAQVERMLPSSSLASKLGSFLSSAFSTTTTAASTETPINPLPLIPSPADYFTPIPPEGYTGAIGAAPRQESATPATDTTTTGVPEADELP